jgi:Type II secretion system (T2SS), protein M subtype b
VTISDRDRRALIGLAAVAVLIVIWRFATESSGTSTVVAAADSIPMAERRLTKLRQIAAAIPGKQQILDQVSPELALRERGIVEAESAQQAQAQLMQVLRRIGRAQTPPLDFKNVELGQLRPFGDHYGEVLVSVSFDAGIEQLLNLMADITAEKQLIATNEVRVSAAHPKQKTLPVRLTVSGIVRRQLMPKKGNIGSL